MRVLLNSLSTISLANGVNGATMKSLIFQVPKMRRPSLRQDIDRTPSLHFSEVRNLGAPYIHINTLLRTLQNRSVEGQRRSKNRNRKRLSGELLVETMKWAKCEAGSETAIWSKRDHFSVLEGSASEDTLSESLVRLRHGESR